MKKSLFILASAALVLASCNNDVQIAENVGLADGNQQKEIAFTPYAQVPNRVKGNAPISGTTFPTDLHMMVTAYDATASAVFFDAADFAKDGTNWTGGKYWPYQAATINFLAIANANADNETGVTWGTNKADQVTVVMSDNSSAQRDLMYACGTGTVALSGNTLTFPASPVSMVFKHAQAWLHFTVKAGDAASATAITVNSITLNTVSCAGTYTITHTNYDQTKAARDADASKNGSVAGVWSAYGDGSNIAAVGATGYSALSEEAQNFADLLVVPARGIASFTINFTLDDGNTYNYTYTPASTTLAQATKYTYNITLTAHKIEIAPSITDWTEGGPTAVEIPEE
ncbi:MAG: fimbrillin family protein [Paludibacteraceae bacterium]|nr:fimbrillin family protein [Paludibacteraceae bacterium]